MRQAESSRKIDEIGFPILVGLGLGVLNVLIASLPLKWAGALMMAVIAPVVVMLIGDLRKIILITMVVNLPLGFDVSIQNRTDHQGGPGGYVVSLLTFALIAGYALWIIERRRSNAYSFKSMTIPLLVFIFTAVVSLFQSVDITFSLCSIFMLIQVFLMYFYVINHVKTWADFRLIINAWAVCLALEGILMIVQYLTGASFAFAGVGSRAFLDTTASVRGARVGGTIGSANGAAIWLAPSLAITMGAYLIYSELKLPEAKWALLAFLLGVVGMIVTFSRSGWSAFGLAVLILGSLAIKRGVGKKALIPLLVFGLLATGLFSNLIIQRLTGDDAGSIESRKIAARMAYNMIEANPLGVGINNFNERRMEYLPRELVGQPPKWVYIVHNHYLLTWAETGFQGLLSFVAILLAAVLRGIRWLNQRSDARVFVISASLLAALAGYLLHMRSDIFSWPMTVQLLWVMLALITAVGHLAEEPLPGDQSGSLSNSLVG
jgi:O-antigen ligase